jgi:TetR/AcrR family transcriptional regulator, copper-responsive repressor
MKYSTLLDCKVFIYCLVQNMSSQKRSPGRPRAFNLEKALDQAVLKFWQKGYFGASLDDLTAAMGINRPSLYAAFGDKQTLFLQCVDRYAETIGQKPSLALSNEDIHHAIVGFFNAVVETVCNESTPKGCLIACTLAECAEDIPEVRNRLEAAIASSDDAIEQRFLQAIQENQLPAHFPGRSRARLATSLMHGIALRARAMDQKPSLIAFANDASELVLGICL